jgi:hypothetical protein
MTKIIEQPLTLAQLRHAIREAQKRVARGSATIAAAHARVLELEPAATAPGASAVMRAAWTQATLCLENARARRQRGIDLEEQLTRQLAKLPPGTPGVGSAPRGRPAIEEGKLLSLRMPDADVKEVTRIAAARYEPRAAVLRRYVREGLARDQVALAGATVATAGGAV